MAYMISKFSKVLDLGDRNGCILLWISAYLSEELNTKG